MSAINTPSYKSVGTIRAAAILTGAYVVAKTFGIVDTTENQSDAQNRNIEASHLVLDINFTKGSLTSCGIKVEYSDDNTNWYSGTSVSTSSGVATVSPTVYTFTADAAVSLAIPLIPHPYMRVSAIGDGTATGSSLALQARFIS